MNEDFSEPRRLIEDAGSDPIVRRVLAAGRAEKPTSAALSAAPAAVAALMATQTATAAAGTSAAVLALKWALLGVALGGSFVGALEATRGPSAQPRPSALVVRATAARGSPARSEPSAPAGSASAEPALAPPAQSVSPRASLSADLSREVALLDAARSALAQGSPTRAVEQLERAERLPKRALAPEATVLRVRALLALGQTEQARAIAERFERSAPRAPQSALLRELIGTR